MINILLQNLSKKDKMEFEKMLERIDIREKYKLLAKIGPYYEKKQLYEITTFSCGKLYIVKFYINISIDILFDFVYNDKRGINQRCKWLALKLNNRFKKNNRQVSQAQAIIFLQTYHYLTRHQDVWFIV